MRQPHRAQRRRHQHRPRAQQRVPGRRRRRAAGAARSRCPGRPHRRSAAPPRRPGTPSVLRPPPCAVPARAARHAPPSIRTVTGSVSSKRVSRVKSTAVGAVNRVNSTGCSGLVADLRAHREQQPQRRYREQHQLEHELERLDVGRRPHPAQGQRHAHHDPGHDHADPVRRAADQRQHLARRRELRHQVQVADHEHDQGAQLAQHRGAEPGLGEVGDGQRAGAPHGRRDQRQHQQVAGGEPDRVPERPDPALDDQPGDAEERRRRQVLPGHGRGVEGGGDAAGGDEEVRRRAHRRHPAGADEQRGQHHGHDRECDHGPSVLAPRPVRRGAAATRPARPAPATAARRPPARRPARRTAARRRARGRAAAAAAGPRGRPRRRAGPSPPGAAARRGPARPAPARRVSAAERGRADRAGRRARPGSAGWSPRPGAAASPGPARHRNLRFIGRPGGPRSRTRRAWRRRAAGRAAPGRAGGSPGRRRRRCARAARR